MCTKHEALIVAAGASARLLGLKGEKELIGRGVSTCATCDGYFFRTKPIAVVGGGDTAMEEANFLTRHASKVYLIHRRDEFRASKIMIDRAKANPKVEFVTPYVVEDFLAPDGLVSGIRLQQVTNGEKRELPVDGVFIAIGHDPNSIIFRGKLEMDENGYLIRAPWKPDERARCVYCWRRAGSPLPAGGYRGGFRLHGRTGRGKVPC